MPSNPFFLIFKTDRQMIEFSAPVYHLLSLAFSLRPSSAHASISHLSIHKIS